MVGRRAGGHDDEAQFILGSVLGCGTFVAKLIAGRLWFLYIGSPYKASLSTTVNSLRLLG